MSWGTCYSGSNNIFYSAPPLMSDGRNFASWVPGREIDQDIKKKMNITNNNSYRQFLINNADMIVKFNQLQSCNNCACCPYFNNNKQTPNNPYLFNSCLDNNKPFGYENSDLKNLYLSRDQLAIIRSNPITFQIK